MALRVQQTIKINCYSGIKFDPQSQQRKFCDLKKKYCFNKVYDSDREPGPFCNMEDIEDTQYVYEYALPDVSTPDAGFFISD